MLARHADAHGHAHARDQLCVHFSAGVARRLTAVGHSKQCRECLAHGYGAPAAGCYHVQIMHGVNTGVHVAGVTMSRAGRFDAAARGGMKGTCQTDVRGSLQAAGLVEGANTGSSSQIRRSAAPMGQMVQPAAAHGHPVHGPKERMGQRLSRVMSAWCLGMVPQGPRASQSNVPLGAAGGGSGRGVGLKLILAEALVQPLPAPLGCARLPHVRLGQALRQGRGVQDVRALLRAGRKFVFPKGLVQPPAACGRGQGPQGWQPHPPQRARPGRSLLQVTMKGGDGAGRCNIVH